MEAFKMGALNITADHRNGAPLMYWSGQSAERFPSLELTPYLKDVANHLSGKQLAVSFKQLQYMNSSTVPAIIQFMKQLDQNGVKTEFIYDKSSKWQCASFKALETLASMMRNISVCGG